TSCEVRELKYEYMVGDKYEQLSYLL
ncbi:hypothetical protein HMPREF0984_00398, partial [Eubacterium sp. 3_1_31]